MGGAACGHAFPKKGAAALALVVFSFAKSNQETPLSAV
jgi:hypothetical protein